MLPGRRVAVDNVGDGNRKVSPQRPGSGRRRGRKVVEEPEYQDAEATDPDMSQGKEEDYNRSEMSAEEEETTESYTTTGTDLSALTDLPEDPTRYHHQSGAQRWRGKRGAETPKRVSRPVSVCTESSMPTSNGENLQVSLEKLKSIKGTICAMYAEKMKDAGITSSKMKSCLGEMKTQLKKELKKVSKKAAGQEDSVVRNVMAELREGEMILLRMAELEESASFFDEVIKESIRRTQTNRRGIFNRIFPWLKSKHNIKTAKR